MIRTKLPNFLHHYFFKRLAKKRVSKATHDYQTIGGSSPIFEDTEKVAMALKNKVEGSFLTFHRYLPMTHSQFIEKISQIKTDEIRVFPMFPQFTYATTGSIARWFGNHLSKQVVNRMRWIKSYPGHPSFIKAHQTLIRSYLAQHHLDEKETILLFSAHGIPQDFVNTGDPYESECHISYKLIMDAFPNALGKLCYQSKFGRGEWLKPYTIDICEQIKSWNAGRKNVVFVPLSFTSDHIETLFEIETEYMPVVRREGLNAFRVPGLAFHPEWLDAITDILQESNLTTNSMLINFLDVHKSF